MASYSKKDAMRIVYGLIGVGVAVGLLIAGAVALFA